MSSQIGRRTVLRGLGAGGALASMRLLRGSQAFAQNGQIPKRVLFFYTDTGNLPGHPDDTIRRPGNWEPLAPDGMSVPSETQFELNTMMRPLEPHKRDMILFENLDMNQDAVDPTPPGNAHHAGSSIALTGANRFNGELPGKISIDQFIARQLNDPTPLTPLPSLEVLLASYEIYNSSASAVGPGQTVPMLYEPKDVYARVFPDGVSPQQDPAAGAAAASQAAQENLIFQFLEREYNGLRDRLGREDREKVQQHFDAVSELDSRLSLQMRDVALPEPSIADPFTEVYRGYTEDSELSNTLFHLSSDINIDIAVAALHADVTRVATLWMPDPPMSSYDYVPGQFGATDGHDLQHKVNDANTGSYSDNGAREVLQRQHLLVMEKFARLLAGLAARTESDGSRLLDHTVVVYCSEIANGSHSLRRLPWMVVGSGGGYFSTGRYIQFPRAKASFVPDWDAAGRAHNDLFVSVANAMGIDIDTFGTASINGGPITEMRG